LERIAATVNKFDRFNSGVVRDSDYDIVRVIASRIISKR
jgi:hypothetical protein